MEKFINAIVFDDGYHDKYVICEGDIHKYSFWLFVNKIAICHDETYIIKTIHYENLEESNIVEAFEVMDSSTEMFHTEETVKAFEILWNCEDAVEGIDVY